MATVLDDAPAFPERISGASLIVTGTVKRAGGSVVEKLEDGARVLTTFDVAVTDVLKGESPSEVLAVRVVGGRTDGVETPMDAPLGEGQDVLLMLAPDVGPDRDEKAFVPYFSSVYVVTGKGRIRLNRQAAKELAEIGRPMEGESVEIKVIREIIALQEEQRAKEAELLEEYEPVESREALEGDVGEMPPPEIRRYAAGEVAAVLQAEAEGVRLSMPEDEED